MKTLSRFLTVFWFQASITVWPIVILVILTCLGWVGPSKYYGDLHLAIFPFLLTAWVVMTAVIAIYLPESFLPVATVKNARSTAACLLSLEFLATRAVSRSCVFRVRGAIFWGILLTSIFCWVAWSAVHPSLTLLLPSYSGDAAKAGLYLACIPGSVVERISSDGDVTVRMPTGNLQLHILLGATMVILSSIWISLVPLLARLPFRRQIFWAVVIGGNFLMTVVMPRQRELEACLLFGMQYLPYLVVGATALAIVAEWSSGKRLAMMELM